MKHRYYSTERPVSPGSFPKKQGCEIENYENKTFIPSIGFSAWGHIDYIGPLTEKETKDYELIPEN